jgi:membrane-associated PAP2 superfamily phosphatase
MNLRRSDLLVTMLGLLLLLAWDASSLDMWLLQGWAGPDGFPWRERWLTSQLLHHGGRWLAGLALALLVVNLWWPVFDGLTSSERWRWLIVTLLALLLVPSLKQVSTTSCPWDLAQFGGHALHVSHWQFGVRDGGGGHCFPSGHATSAVAFFSGWFALRDRHPRAARWWLATVCGLALLLGWGQMVRGAHYASHTLWSAWLCWTLAMLAMNIRFRAVPALQP